MAPVALSGSCPSWIARVSKCTGGMLRAEPRAEARERLVGTRGVAPGAEHIELAALAVEPRLDPADEAVADEDGQDVVAVLPLRPRHVHLEPVAEVEERLGAVAVVDQSVERGEEGHAVGDGAVGDIGVGFTPLGRQPDAERSEALLGALLLGLTQRDPLDLWVPALGEIPESLPVAAADDRHAPAAVEDLQRDRDVAGAPPAAGLEGAYRMVLELAREHR